MPGQARVGDGVQPDNVKADALVFPSEHIVQNGIVDAGIVSEICWSAPVLVPPEIEEQKFRLLSFFTVFCYAGKVDNTAFGDIPAIYHEGGTDELLGGESVSG